MAHDDKERAVLPARVERALAEARRASARGRTGPGEASPPKPKESRALALVPVGVCLVFLLLLMPRATKPDSVPLPDVDERVVDAVVHDDHARAVRARAERLPPDVLAVGTAFRAVQAADARHADEEAQMNARTELREALRVVLARKDSVPELVSLRAVQLEAFLAEVQRFESTGATSQELEELGGAFVERMRAVGWVTGDRLVPDEAQLRVAYKLMWNAVVGDVDKALALTLDEQRVLYTLYLRHPHAPEARRAELDAERRAARDELSCERAASSERRAVEKWRSDKIRQLGRIDPSYPTDYALGVSYFRGEQYDLAVQSFRAWIDAHPDGAWSLRARNHLKAAVDASGVL